MQKRKQQLFALALALWAFSSCSQDARDAEVSTTGGQTVTFSLDAEVSVDDSELRAIEYKLGKNTKNQLVPLPQFTDKQEVEVHTILKSSNGSAVARTLKWRYDASKKKLVLKQTDGHRIIVSGFNNDSGVKWYISGLIGGDLWGTKVEFMGTRVVKGVNGNAGDALGSMEVPYAFGWTELIINTESTKDSQGSYKYAEVPKSKNVKFQPLGSMLAVKLGTNQRAGAYTFTPKGFTLSSNAWGDQGSFQLNTDIPLTDPHTALPTWTEGSCAGSMYYTFASGEEPGAIAHNQTTAKTYYVWVMPHKALPTTADVRVMLKGTSSRPETATYKDYTNTWFTDYTTEGKATQGKVTQGRVHLLTAKAIRRLAMPIEYVTEYNLAGGEGLTYTAAPGTRAGQLNSPDLGGVQPAGVTGPLRFATSHRNDQSGYYNWYKVMGLHHNIFNPDTRNLQNEINNIFGVGRYYIPTHDQWLSNFPTYSPWTANFWGIDRLEWMRVGVGSDELKQSYLSDYSMGISADDNTSDATVYAIRFKARRTSCSPHSESWDYDATTGAIRSHTYPSALDDNMKCAYRFRRVEGRSSWLETDENMNLTSRVIIDVVYLGEELVSTRLDDISDESWWSAKQSQGQLISRSFPASGRFNVEDQDKPARLVVRGRYGEYWSSSSFNSFTIWYSMVNMSDIIRAGTGPRNGLSVRLFKQVDL